MQARVVMSLTYDLKQALSTSSSAHAETTRVECVLRGHVEYYVPKEKHSLAVLYTALMEQSVR